ncbi:MAG: DUF6702 family protein [Phycisphaerales bacterium]
MKSNIHVWSVWLAVLTAALFCARPALGHAEGESYVWMNAETDRLEGHFELRLVDLRSRFGLPIPEDEAGARAFLPQTEATLHAYLRERFELRVDGEVVPYEFFGTEFDPAPRYGNYVMYRFRTAPMDVPERVEVRNEIFFDLDPQQRSLLCIEHDRLLGVEYGEEYTALIFRPSETVQVFDRLALDPSRKVQLFRLKDVARSGVNAWLAPAHWMFLAAAILPVGLRRRRRGGTLDGALAAPADPIASAEPGGNGTTTTAPASALLVIGRALVVAVCFTLAWAAGIGLSAGGIVQFAPGVMAIAALATVLVVAASNLLSPAMWTGLFIVMLLGVVHGVGLSAPLADVPFRMGDLRSVLIAFIGGVGVAQLAGFIGLTVLVLLMRRRAWYRPVLVTGGSLVLAAAAAVLLVLPLAASNGSAP